VRNVELQRNRTFPGFLLLLVFTVTGCLVMGYHPGFEDDGVYLPAIKADLNPALYPHDSAFFQLQMQATLFPEAMAHFVRWTHVPLAWSELLGQFAALFLILWACRRIAAQLFAAPAAQWAAVAMVCAMFTLPVAGTALNIADQHLHPRNLATGLILMAVSLILDASQLASPMLKLPARSSSTGPSKRWLAAALLLAAFAIHPVMAALGISFSVFLGLGLAGTLSAWAHKLAGIRSSAARIPARGTALALAAPLAWLFAPAGPAWRDAFASRPYYSVYRWAWYEWLGALAPLALFALLAWLASHSAQPASESRQPAVAFLLPGPPQTLLAPFALAVFAYGVFQQLVAMVLLAPAWLERLAPLQPMRYLQLVYVFMALAGGGLLGRFLLKTNPWRWAVYLLLINGGMFLVQWEVIDDGAHLELPGRANADPVSANPWLQAFEWVRLNTPVDAYFALDPHYLAAPGQGFHGFRALAERSQLADAIKDTSVVIQVPSLAETWAAQQQAQAGWEHFRLADFERLKSQFGVDWVLVASAQTAGLDCRWQKSGISVCRIP
jgi:hypothetical protein